MADLYIDFQNGDDSTGDGSSGNPWKTLQKGIDNANGGDAIKVANTAADVLSASLTWNTGFGATLGTSANARLIIEGWDNGGSLEITHPVGNWAAGKIDGNNVSTIFSGASQPQYVTLRRMIFLNTTANVVSLAANSGLIECDVSDSSGASNHLVNAPKFVVNCILRDSTGRGIGGTVGSMVVIGNVFRNLGGLGISLGNSNMFLVSNLFSDIAATHVAWDRFRPDQYIIGNTFVGNGTANAGAIDNGNTAGAGSAHGHTILSNIFANFSGTGGFGLDHIGDSTSPTNSVLLTGYNLYYNNTTHKVGSPVIDLGGDQIDVDPQFADPGNDDYTPGANARGIGWPRGFAGTSIQNYIDLGAIQALISGGVTGNPHGPFVRPFVGSRL